jgi:hypothetical protein
VAGGRLIQALNRQDSQEAASFDLPIADHGRAGVHLWFAALNYAASLDRQVAQGHPLTVGQAAWYGQLLRAVDERTDQGRAGIRLAALTLAMRNDLAENQDTALAGLRAEALPIWGRSVLRVIRLAPDRTDVAVPYLGWLLAHKQVLPALSLCGRIFSLHPHDRVCRWYGGAALLGDKATEAEGLADMRGALADGVDAVVPVTPAARAQIEATGRPAPR